MDAAEAKRLGDIFTNKSDPRWESLYTDGITAGGERFVVYRFMDEKTDIFAKKVSRVIGELGNEACPGTDNHNRASRDSL